jgi:hypothetical protein
MRNVNHDAKLRTLGQQAISVAIFDPGKNEDPEKNEMLPLKPRWPQEGR